MKLWRKKSSIALKWTVTSSIFIFIILTIFAFFSYKNASDVILTKEKQNLILTEKNMVELLEKNEVLNFQTILSSFTKENIATDLKQKDSLGEKEDTYITDISHPYLGIYIYDANKKIVFKTKHKEIPYAEIETKNHVEEKDGHYLEITREIKNNDKVIGYSLLRYEIENIQQMKRELLKTSAFLELAAIIIAIFLGHHLSSYFLKPLKNLRDTMEIIRLDPQSKTSATIKKTNDELEDLGNIFNEMLQEIRNYISQQEQFVQDASHELRTPIAIIKGHLELINRWGKEDPEVLTESIDASLEEIKRMQQLVEEMLLLSKSKSKNQNDKSELLVIPTIEKVLANYHLIHPTYEFKLQKVADQLTKIQISANHLDQLLIILLDNAIKYAPESKKIDITVYEDKKSVYVDVKDFGQGISPENLNKIFNRFFRVDEARSKEISGNGLGLPIAKEIMNTYGGTIKGSSIVGEGTTFTLQFNKIL